MSAIQGQAWRALAEEAATSTQEELRGLDALAMKLRGRVRRAMRGTKTYLERAGLVVAMERGLAEMADRRLDEEAAAVRAIIRRGRDTLEDRLRATAVVRETAFRELGMRPFAVQVAGALAIDDGCIVEMATGEGKTLTATMPATIGGWRGRGCHVVTANDYLATRDAQTLGKLYARLGLRCAALDGDMDGPARRAVYAADITYCTNKQIAADYLRDRLAMGRSKGLTPALIDAIGGKRKRSDGTVMRGLAQAIIDEADFVLVDESVTPLIISSTSPDAPSAEQFGLAKRLAGELDEGTDYKVDLVHREIVMTPKGKRRLLALVTATEAGEEWLTERRMEELVVNALTAGRLFEAGRQYIVHEGKIVIVDESTGRLMPDRSWRDGMHQAVEAKEGVEIQPVKETRARISFQRFFRMYKKLGGMSGTVREAADELWGVYRTPVVAIPTNRPRKRESLPDRIFATSDEKWAAVVEEIQEVRAAGRPVLVGTRSVGDSERLSAMLHEAGVEHRVLNAVRHQEEAAIIARAGEAGTVTVATNMAGRGTDILLDSIAREKGGLHVIGTARHDSRRVDRQLEGRAGRQGDPGSARFFMSMDDELLDQHAPTMAWGVRRGMRGRGGDVTGPAARGVFAAAQARAAAVGRAARRMVLRNDEWLDDWLGFAGRE